MNVVVSNVRMPPKFRQPIGRTSTAQIPYLKRSTPAPELQYATTFADSNPLWREMDRWDNEMRRSADENQLYADVVAHSQRRPTGVTQFQQTGPSQPTGPPELSNLERAGGTIGAPVVAPQPPIVESIPLFDSVVDPGATLDSVVVVPVSAAAPPMETATTPPSVQQDTVAIEPILTPSPNPRPPVAVDNAMFQGADTIGPRIVRLMGENRTITVQVYRGVDNQYVVTQQQPQPRNVRFKKQEGTDEYRYLPSSQRSDRPVSRAKTPAPRPKIDARALFAELEQLRQQRGHYIDPDDEPLWRRYSQKKRRGEEK